MEIAWKNKDKSLFIDYNNGFNLTWVPKNSPLITKIGKLVPYDKYSVNSKDVLPLNSLILGDNLFVLNILQELFKKFDESKKIKFVYIDPPYNTFNPELSYKDNLPHDEWLTFMQDRLERVKQLLRSDGVVCIQIDDREYARLFLLMAEIFGEKNLKTIVVKMSESSGVKMQIAKLGGIPKLKEYLILAKMDGLQGFHFEQVTKKQWDPEYNIFIKNFTLEDKEKIQAYEKKSVLSQADMREIDKICKKFELVSITKALEDNKIAEQSKIDFCKDNSWRICRTASSSSIFKLTEEKKLQLTELQQVFSVISKRGLLYLVKSDYTPDSRKPRVQILFADDHLQTPLGDLWTDIKTTGLEFEGNIDFKNGKKPEKLIKRLIDGITNEGEIVLDLFGGSGTVASVCLDLKREFISIEVNNDIFSISIERMNNKVKELKKSSVKVATNVNYYELSLE